MLEQRRKERLEETDKEFQDAMKAHKKALAAKSTDGDLSAIAEANDLLAQAEKEAKQYSKRYDTQSEKKYADV